MNINSDNTVSRCFNTAPIQAIKSKTQPAEGFSDKLKANALIEKMKTDRDAIIS